MMASTRLVNNLKRQLIQTYRQFGQLTHPEVVRVSQLLDHALNELNGRPSARSSGHHSQP
ncbi:aspartyl-phosphate phosphatase Spo0E family protein [Cohnella caldifontis]|uniref:aspartyl-phosphate phosphatase Spo0E family protein n=1 Tax=Cohnella caldifontis TaxID=3027471 RepID=UPI0023ECF512|nr:aspartyl-phosphate phosphatase Spo0E family protein [Cohnella sp. YIM B05605]